MRAPEAPDSAVGLCAACRFAIAQKNAKGNVFQRCTRADTDAAYLRYPRLPVISCDGFEKTRETD